VAIRSSKTGIMAFDQLCEKVESVLGAGKRPEGKSFLAHLSLNVASVPLPIDKSVLEREKKNGSILAILLLPDTQPALHVSLRSVTP